MGYQEYRKIETKTVKAIQFTDTKPETLKMIQEFIGSDDGLTIDFSNIKNPKLKLSKCCFACELGDYIVKDDKIRVSIKAEFETLYESLRME